MSYASKLFVAAVAGCLWIFPAIAEPLPCTTCEPPKQQTMRERIRSDREKYDLENAKTTARPWDGLNLGRAQPDGKTPVVR
jgi:hypothetical protein